MASGLVSRGSNRFDAVYEHPYGGVSSAADAADIQPNEFVAGNGLVIKNGRLCVCAWNNINTINYTDGTGGFLDYWLDSLIRTVFTVGTTLIAVSNIGQAYIYNSATDRFVLDQVLTGATGFPNLDCWQVIGGVVYFFDFNNGASYVYTPTVSFVVNNTYVGGKYCTEILGYLITANTNQPTDSPAIKTNRFNWSSPYAYGVWDAAIDRTAGYINISDAQDQITGCFAMGNVAYIIREQGLTQLSPTGIGTQPFDPLPMWASEFGLGCTYPATFAQYGNMAAWVNDNNIYAFFAGAMPQGIAGGAKAAIFQDINAHEGDTTWSVNLSGSLSNSGPTNKVPELLYTICIVSSQGTTGIISAVFWTYNVSNSTWTRQVLDVLAAIRVVTAQPNFEFSPEYLYVKGVKITAVSGGIQLLFKRIVNTLIISGTTAGPGTAYSFMFAQYINDDGVPIVGALASGGFSVTYKQEEVRLDTQPTVRSVIVKAAGAGTAGQATIAVDVNGVAFTDIIVDSNEPQTYVSSGLYTGENPQLTLSSGTLDGYIVKVNMPITNAEGEPT